MRQRIVATAAGLALAVMLLVNFRTPEDLIAAASASGTAGNAKTASGGGTTRSGSGNGSTTGSGSTSSGGSTGTSGVAGTTQPAPTTAAGAGQFTGPMAADPYGNVQVQITVSGGKVVDVVALAMPVGGHSGRISNYVAPILRTQALAVQSANIDGVSGATYTSLAYAASLQGALDQAGL
ncbi:MAG: FMN-binding protein [Chloroflexota bacterium]